MTQPSGASSKHAWVTATTLEAPSGARAVTPFEGYDTDAVLLNITPSARVGLKALRASWRLVPMLGRR